MTQARFKIVFNGELMPEVALDTAKDNLARLFKSDRTRINSLFSGSTFALKRDLGESEADQYLAALQRAGANARKEPDLAASLTLVETEEHNPVVAADTVSGAEMTCPKCGKQQAKTAECSACGIIIEKYLARQALLAESAPRVASNNVSSNTPYAPPQAAVGEAVAEIGDLKVFSTDGRIGRLRYLAWSLVLMFAASGVMAVVAIAASISEVLGGLLGIAVVIGMLVVSVQIGAQRLHDIGWSGWLLLLNIVPIINSVFWLLMLVIPGTLGANRFGPPQPANSTAVKVLAGLFLALLLGGVLTLFLGGFAMLGLALSGLDLGALGTPSN
ncbi:uncharacterized membrane protein YhaH (DUF805 family) [Pseudomonas sp. SJZ079]|uniref:DUF805 domain-containing protein n=1 Tax=Pseudomonas sp. SJZ079 TaxID=2572887 RepID=UPI00119A8B43|nr:DUF805 domain-containing protein [Pseudomonas sp. SJZ079]TWC33171.1 uncharacterized membrane protein YhaH (DUF805 family) [Pseudomonas sp. SJZ079]